MSGAESSRAHAGELRLGKLDWLSHFNRMTQIAMSTAELQSRFLEYGSAITAKVTGGLERRSNFFGRANID